MKNIGENYDRLRDGAKEYVKELFDAISQTEEFKKIYFSKKNESS